MADGYGRKQWRENLARHLERLQSDLGERSEGRVREPEVRVEAISVARQELPAPPSAPPTPLEPPPPPRPVHAPFSNWLAQHAPEWFSLLRLVYRGTRGFWRRRTVTLPLVILLAALPLVAFLPSMEMQRPLLLAAGAFLIVMASVVYVALRLYEFALSSNAEARRLADQLAALHLLNGQTEAKAHDSMKALEAVNAKQRSVDAHNAALRNDLDANLRAQSTETDFRIQALWKQADRLKQALDTLAEDGERLRNALSEEIATLMEANSAAAARRDAMLRIEFAAQTQNALDQIDALAAQANAAREQLAGVEAGAAEAYAAVRADLGAELMRVQETINALTTAAEERQAGLRAELTQQIEGAAQRLDALSAAVERGDTAVRADMTAQLQDAQQKLAAIETGAKEGTAKLTHSLEKALENIQKVAEAQSAAEQKIGNLSERSISTHLAAALRSMRPFWTGVSAVKALQNQVEFEHGHELMMAVLSDEERQHPGAIVGKCLIEIGTTREAVPAQSSTQKLALFTAMMGMRFITVDMDPENTKAASNIMKLLNPAAQALTGRGEDYLPRHPGPLEFVYLDAFDFDHGMHSEARKDKYRKILGTDITDPACWKMHEACAETIATRMEPGGIVVLDDTWTDENARFAGKGKLAVPLLLDHGFQIIARTRQTIALKRVSPVP